MALTALFLSSGCRYAADPVSGHAIRLLIVVAEENGRTVTVSAAGLKLGMSRHHLVTVAHLLVRKGFVTGTSGCTGASQVKKGAEGIRLGEIVRLTEPTVIPVECMQGTGACTQEKVCRCPSYPHRDIQAFLHELDQATPVSVTPSHCVN